MSHERPPDAGDGYERVLDAVARRLPALRAQVARDRLRIESLYADLVDQPHGRRETVLANSSSTLLLALAYDLMRRSHSFRFDDTARALRLAQLAHEVAVTVRLRRDFSEAVGADLVGESLSYLGNAQRLNAQFSAAETSLAQARDFLWAGTRDRLARALRLRFLATLRQAEGLPDEAAAIHDREIKLRRLLGDPNALGTTLIDRGRIACWTGEPLTAACAFIRDGIRLVDEQHMVFLGLLHLAEAFARSNDPFRSWKLLRASGGILSEIGLGPAFERRHRWIQGITYRLVDQPARAEEVLTSVRDEFLEGDLPLAAADVSLDLMPALAAQGKHDLLAPLAEATYRRFATEGLGKQALSALIIVQQAAVARRLTEDLASRVANFVARFQNNRKVRFE